MEYKHKKTPQNGVPIHEYAQLWSTNLKKRPFMQYKPIKTPNSRVTIHENAQLWS